MIITIDSNVLLSIFSKDSNYDHASALLYEYSSSEYIINGCIYLELGVHFQHFEALNTALNTLEVRLVEGDKMDYDEVLKAWMRYLKKNEFYCPNCKGVIKPICPVCHHKQRYRQRILTDFLIGGFASANSNGIMTFDSRYYKNYFPRLKIFD